MLPQALMRVGSRSCPTGLEDGWANFFSTHDSLWGVPGINRGVSVHIDYVDSDFREKIDGLAFHWANQKSMEQGSYGDVRECYSTQGKAAYFLWARASRQKWFIPAPIESGIECGEPL